MNETFKNVWARVAPFVNRFSPRQRRNITIATVAGILCLVAILWVVARPHYVTVLTGLDDKSLGQVQTELQTLKIPDKIQGSSVLVPNSQADTARVQLAEAGLPESGYIGYQSVSSSFGMTEDQFNIQVLDALQQSLDATIQSINGVTSAQVHLVMPTQQLFVSQPTSTAKASVFVDVANGTQLSGVQVAGIQQLVAHSVQGLATSDVSVVDQNGVTLSNADGSAGTAGDTSGELATRQNLESQMQQQITNELNQIVGPGNAVVTVHADVTFNQVSSKSHEVQPANGQTNGLISSQQVSRSSSTTGNTTGGAAGQSSTNPNLPTYGTSGTGSGASQSTNTSTTTNYDNGYTDTQTVADPIQINGYSVGVFLNGSDKAVTSQVVSQIQQFVNNAIGAKTGQNSSNSVFVSKVPFQSVPVTTAAASKNSKLFLYGGIGLGAVVVLGGVFLMMRRRRSEEEPATTVQAQSIEDLEDELQKAGLSDEEKRKMQLANLANQKPEEFANLVRTWLVGE